MPEGQEGEKTPPTKGEKSWRSMMLVVLVNQYAQMLQSTAAKLYAEFRARREPGVVAPSVAKEAAAASRSVKKAEERLHKAQAKAKETQEKVAKAQGKSSSSSSSRGGKAKASGKSSSSSSSSAADLGSKPGGPPPKGGSSSGSSNPLVDTGASTNVAPAGFNPKARVVVAGHAESSESEQEPQWSAQQMLYLTQMWNLMQAQQHAGLSMTDIQSAFLNGPMTGLA